MLFVQLVRNKIVQATAPHKGAGLRLMKPLRIVLSSPGDVPEERRVIDEVIAEINRGIAADRDLCLEVWRWETDTYPGFHADGPQGLIDPLLQIETCDLLLGIFWKRFGTPTKGALSGTEHEIRQAIEHWRKAGRPQIMMYFNEAPYSPKSTAETQQWGLVLKFREEFPKEGLYWTYSGVADFEKQVRKHLSNYLRQNFPIAPAEPKPSAPGPASREQEILQHYRRKVQQRFSTINLFGEKRAMAGENSNALTRMSEMSHGFVPLHLQAWRDETDLHATPLEIAELFFKQKEPRRFLIRGLPGSGKTTLLRYLAYHFAGEGAMLPVYLRCKGLNLAKTSLEEFVREKINDECESKEDHQTLCAAERFLEKPMALLWDGVDEIEDIETSKGFAAALDKLARANPRCKMIVTSRPIGLRREDFPKFHALDLLPLTPEMIADYVRKWFGDAADSPETFLPQHGRGMLSANSAVANADETSAQPRLEQTRGDSPATLPPRLGRGLLSANSAVANADETSAQPRLEQTRGDSPETFLPRLGRGLLSDNSAVANADETSAQPRLEQTRATAIAALKHTFDTKPRIRGLAANPFLLSMICFTYEHGGDTALIERRSSLYENCTKALLQRAYDTEAATFSAKPDMKQTLAVLKDLSLRFFLWQEADFPVDQVNVLGQRLLSATALGQTEDFLDRLQRDTGLVQRDKEGFTFVHRSLWEYFTALALRDKKSDFVIRHAANPDWEEVVRLYAGLLQNEDEILALVEGLWTINRPLALRVCTEVQTPAADLLKPLIEKEQGNQSRLLLIDDLAQSLPLVPESERKTLVQETLEILLVACEEQDCEVIYRGELLLERMGMQPLAPGGLLYDLFDLAHAAERQRKFLNDSANHFEWVAVEGGEFKMGDDEHFDNEKPVHPVKVSGFRLAKHPVTWRMLKQFPFGSTYSGYGGENHPAIAQTWFQAYYFALWIGSRLPTEAEWEYAARGGKEGVRTQYYFGDNVEELPNHAWFGESGREHAHAVDEINPRTGKENLNQLGLANMLGNVWDWCADWYDGNYYENSPVENPQGPAQGSLKALRGGSWLDIPSLLRCAYRYRNSPSDPNAGVGIRCAQDGLF